MRKIIQISTTDANDMATMIALCDDGTIWTMPVSGSGWILQENVPRVSLSKIPGAELKGYYMGIDAKSPATV